MLANVCVSACERVILNNCALNLSLLEEEDSGVWGNTTHRDNKSDKKFDMFVNSSEIIMMHNKTTVLKLRAKIYFWS